MVSSFLKIQKLIFCSNFAPMSLKTVPKTRRSKMADIRKRGPYQWQVRIRRKGHPSQTKTFNTKAEAEAWAQVTESEMVRGVFVSRKEAENTTLAEALDRYETEISSKKKSHSIEKVYIRTLKKGLSFISIPFDNTRKGYRAIPGRSSRTGLADSGPSRTGTSFPSVHDRRQGMGNFRTDQSGFSRWAAPPQRRPGPSITSWGDREVAKRISGLAPSDYSIRAGNSYAPV